MPTCQAPLAGGAPVQRRSPPKLTSTGSCRLARGEVGDEIDGVLLADAAEVDLHASRAACNTGGSHSARCQPT